MATREEMGKALWAAYYEETRLPDGEVWARTAERFAAWLREQKPILSLCAKCGCMYGDDREEGIMAYGQKLYELMHEGHQGIGTDKWAELPETIRHWWALKACDFIVWARAYPPPLTGAILSPAPSATDVVCPRCGLVLSHPEDIERRYCGHCREFI